MVSHRPTHLHFSIMCTIFSSFQKNLSYLFGLTNFSFFLNQKKQIVINECLSVS